MMAAIRIDAPVATLLEIARRYGTPTYAYDLRQMRAQTEKLRRVLPAAVQVIYSLKANAALGVCGVFAGMGLGADVASAGELVTAQAAGFPSERIFVSGPDKSPALREQLASAPGAILSLDSASEWEQLAGASRHRALLRLRPDFCSHATCSAGPDSRFGLLFDDLPRCRRLAGAPGIRVIGFHVFSGSQVLSAAGIVEQMRGAMKLSLRAAEALGIEPEIIDLGGGFGVPYGPQDQELDLAPIAAELHSILDHKPRIQLVLELGRYLVAPAGWYLTTVIAEQSHRGRRAVVVDGGSHQRGDLCGLGLRTKAWPPVLLARSATDRNAAARDATEGVSHRDLTPTDVLGCLSLPGDVMTEAGLLPDLAVGDVLAFANAGAYGLLASPLLFHGHPLPAEVVFDGSRMDVIRARQPVRGILEGQVALRP